MTDRITAGADTAEELVALEAVDGLGYGNERQGRFAPVADTCS